MPPSALAPIHFLLFSLSLPAFSWGRWGHNSPLTHSSLLFTDSAHSIPLQWPLITRDPLLCSALCIVPSVAMFCKAFLTCSAGRWADTAATVQPNWQSELPIENKTKLHDRGDEAQCTKGSHKDNSFKSKSQHSLGVSYQSLYCKHVYFCCDCANQQAKMACIGVIGSKCGSMGFRKALQLNHFWKNLENGMGRCSLQILAEFDTCLVWELLLLPSNALTVTNLPSLKGTRRRH